MLTLATAAGVAVENARLFGEARRSEEGNAPWRRSIASYSLVPTPMVYCS